MLLSIGLLVRPYHRDDGRANGAAVELRAAEARQRRRKRQL
jgi:predicted NodU family carbamoyl transferase